MNRRFVTLLTTLTFVVIAVTGVIAYIGPFSLRVVGLHSLMGFLFVALVCLHVANSLAPMKRHLRSMTLWVTGAITAIFATVLWLQPAPVKALLGLSGNLGPAMDRFELREDGMAYQYSPSPAYRMNLTVRGGASYDAAKPPRFAVWLENQGGYHIKTLHAPEAGETGSLPYWDFKVKGWQKARREAEEEGQVDAITSATPNGSFDPADYILPADPGSSTPYRLLLEINQPGDAHGEIPDQPSLVYSVEVDNLDPRIYQLLELEGYPAREDEGGKEAWALYYVDGGFGSALRLIDSALLEIDRSEP
ncbi:hypothetical protein HZ994_06370 [Akkermansiaceae bacterium]|nr:hypothetical protein HZ994_06370 [Akkermansiaceae bacterium]